MHGWLNGCGGETQRYYDRYIDFTWETSFSASIRNPPTTIPLYWTVLLLIAHLSMRKPSSGHHRLTEEHFGAGE